MVEKTRTKRLLDDENARNYFQGAVDEHLEMSLDESDEDFSVDELEHTSTVASMRSSWELLDETDFEGGKKRIYEINGRIYGETVNSSGKMTNLKLLKDHIDSIETERFPSDKIGE